MFNLISILLLAIIGIIGFFVQPEPSGVIHITGIVFLCGAGVWFFSSLMNNFVNYNQQIERFEEIRRDLKKIKIYEEKKDVLISQFKLYLSEKYPEIEKEIFKEISQIKSDIQIVLNYPEIKSSDVLMELVRQINEHSSEWYDKKCNIEYSCAYVRSYIKNMWFYIKPSVPEDILKLL